jgi:RimJ/RimL family protein N-acetyltransferase
MNPLLLDVPSEIFGKRIKLRRYDPIDAREIHAAVEESRKELSVVFDWLTHQNWTIEERRASLIRGQSAWLLRTDMSYGIRDIKTDLYLGDIGIFSPDWNVRRFEIGYWLRTSAVGNGYVTESASLLCDLAFTLFKARRVFIQCDAENNRSAAVPRRLGFELEGILRNERLRPDGTPADVMVFGMTPDRWLK